MAITKIRHRRDTTENWTNTNPILLDGELGFEKTKDGKIKIKYGDGVLEDDGITINGTRWNNLPYLFDPDAEEPEDIGVAPEHKWEGTKLYFKNPNGTWGEPIDIGSMIQTESSTITKYAGSSNKIISGRVRKDGYPEFLVYNKDMKIIHSAGSLSSQFGKVETPVECIAGNTPEIALRNAHTNTANTGWYVASMTSGEWSYTFKEPQVITGVWLNACIDRVNSFPSKWSVVAKNDIDDVWTVIYDRGSQSERPDQYKMGINTNNIQHGRMYWFTENTKAYKIYGIKIDDNNRKVAASSGGADVGFSMVRFFSSPVIGLDKRDVALTASVSNPFIADVSINTEQSRRITISEDIIINGSWLQPSSRNYLYLIPGNSAPDYTKSMNNVKVLGSRGKEFVLGIDTRRIHYESLEELKAECYLLLQSKAVRYDSIGTATTSSNIYETSQGYYDYPIEVKGKLQIANIENHRGSRTAYRFTQAGASCMKANTGVSIPDHRAKRRCNEFTLEMDIKLSILEYANNAYNTSYVSIFDPGFYYVLNTNYYYSGWTLGYMNHTKAFCLRWTNTYNTKTALDTFLNKFAYSIPYNLYDNKWHTISLSRNSNKTLFFHVDGECLGIFTNTYDVINPVNGWSIGKDFINPDNAPVPANIWEGDINNIRYTLGTCLYQGQNYKVSDNFNTSLIPDKTLLWNRERQCVQEYDASSNVWKDTPMIPIGHIDTGMQEHLLTDQPVGSYTQVSSSINTCKYINTIKDSDHNLTTGVLDGYNLFNYGQHSASNGFYGTKATNNTTEFNVTFSLEKGIAFDKIIFVPHLIDGTYTINSFPRVFRLDGSLDGNSWEVILDNSNGDNRGNAFCQLLPQGTAQGVPCFYGMKKYDIPFENQLEYSYYRISFLPKSQGPTYSGDSNTTAAKIIFSIKGGKPEILNVVSYCIGDTWKYGPFPITAVNTQFNIPVPFENLDYDIKGHVDVINESRGIVRELGQSQNGYGEVIFKTRDSIILQIGKTGLNNFVGTYNNTSSSSTINAVAGSIASTSGEVYITCTRRLA